MNKEQKEEAQRIAKARWEKAKAGQALKPVTDKARLAATIDTEEMRMLGTHLNSHMIAFQNHGRKTMVHYLCIGIVLQEAKDRLEHGEWLAWITKYGSGLSHDSATRYINCGRYLEHVSPVKFRTVRNLIEESKHEITPDVAEKIAKKTPELEGKTFRDIGVELKAIKTAKEKRHDAADAHVRATEELTDGQKRTYAAHDAWIKAKAQLATLAPLSGDLSSDDFNDCIGVLEQMLRGLKGEERDGEPVNRREGDH